MSSFKTLLFVLAAASLAGCSLLTSTVDGIGNSLNVTAEGVTNSVASTSDATTTEEEPVAALARARDYSKSQYDMIRRDAAAGDGEHLQALALLMAEPDRAAFGRWMQARYSVLFSSGLDPALLPDRILEQRRATPTQQARL